MYISAIYWVIQVLHMTQPLLQNWFLKDTLLWSINELATNDLLEYRHSRFLESFRQKDKSMVLPALQYQGIVTIV